MRLSAVIRICFVLPFRAVSVTITSLPPPGITDTRSNISFPLSRHTTRITPNRPQGKPLGGFKSSRSTSPDSAGGLAHRKLSLSSRLNPISFEKEDEDDVLVGTEILETIDPDDFVDLVVSSAKARSLDRGSFDCNNNSKSQFDDDFVRSNFANVVWELKACR